MTFQRNLPPPTPCEIYSDNGASIGRRTRLFRQCPSGTGVEWIYAVDYAGGDDRWYTYHPSAAASIQGLLKTEMNLTPYLS